MITKYFLVTTKRQIQKKKQPQHEIVFFEALSHEPLIRLFWQCELQIQLLNQ